MTQLDRIEEILTEILQRLSADKSSGGTGQSLSEHEELQLINDLGVDPIEYAKARQRDKSAAINRLANGWH